MIECQYIRRTRRPGFVKLHCFLKKCDITIEECQQCQYMTVEQPGKTVILDTGETGVLYETPEINRATWLIEHPETFRPDLQAIRTKLPRHERGRRFTMHADGVIVYAQGENEWEPPKDIQGYQRDPENPWRFIPLWPRCMQRQPESKRSKGCGCIEIVMKCDNSKAVLFGQLVTHEQCQLCERRIDT